MKDVHRKCESLIPFYSARRSYCVRAKDMTFELRLASDQDEDSPKILKLKFYFINETVNEL